MIRLQKKRPSRIILALAVMAVYWMSLLSPVGWAHPLYQTVPTMPPPTKTPTGSPIPTLHVTPTRSPLPTATHLAATQTSLYPTSTLPAGSTRTAPTSTVIASATATLIKVTGSPANPSNPTLALQTDTIQLSTSTPGLAPVTTAIPTLDPRTADQDHDGLPLYGIVAGGIVLLVVVLVAIWLNRRQKQVKH